MTQIFVFGDSVTWGAWDIKGGGWVNRLQKYFTEHADPIWNADMVYNLGVSGDTTKDLLERFKAECQARVSESKKYGDSTIIIFDIGKNDSIIERQNAKFGVSTTWQQSEANLRKLIKLAKKLTHDVVFLTSFPVDETKSLPIVWNKKFFYKNQRIQDYNEILKSVCDELHVPVVDVFNKVFDEDYKNLLADGVHLNSVGHERIFEIVREFLIQQYLEKFSYLQK